MSVQKKQWFQLALAFPTSSAKNLVNTLVKCALCLVGVAFPCGKHCRDWTEHQKLVDGFDLMVSEGMDLVGKMNFTPPR